MLVETLQVCTQAGAGTDTSGSFTNARPKADSELVLQVPATALRPATKADTLDIGMASRSSAAALPAETPLASIRCSTSTCHECGF